MKVCGECGIEKNKADFYKDSSKKDGIRKRCKDCTNKSNNNYILNNKSKVDDYQKKYNKENKDKKLKYGKEYREKNNEILKEKQKIFWMNNKERKKPQRDEYVIKNRLKINEKKKEYYENNKKNILIYQEKYNKENKDRIAERRIEWYEKNKEKVIKSNSKYTINRRRNDVKYKLKCIISCNFRSNLFSKNKEFFKYTGFKYNEYIEYFKNNYPIEYNLLSEKNKIHIDHIIPCAVYDFTDEEEIKKCWNPQNLRLVSAKENLKKNKKIDYDLIKKHNIEHLISKKLKG